MKDLEKKCKKAPDDMKAEVKAFVEDAHRGLDELSKGLKNIEKQVKEIADYFCEDPKKLKIEELFSELLAFIRTYEAAVEVRKEKGGGAKKRGTGGKKEESVFWGKIKGPGFRGHVSNIVHMGVEGRGAIKGEGEGRINTDRPV